MTARFLLDTNIISDMVRNPNGAVAAKAAEVGADAIATSVIVAAELHYGAAKKRAPRLTDQIQRALAAIDVLPLEAPADEIYGELRDRLERSGKLIGPNDLLIAAHALALGYVLVTDNTREFARAAGLKTENWLC